MLFRSDIDGAWDYHYIDLDISELVIEEDRYVFNTSWLPRGVYLTTPYLYIEMTNLNQVVELDSVVRELGHLRHRPRSLDRVRFDYTGTVPYACFEVLRTGSLNFVYEKELDDEGHMVDDVPYFICKFDEFVNYCRNIDK